MQGYAFVLTSNVTPTAPLFQAGRFHPLSHPAVTKTLRLLLKQTGLDESQYASHSFRIGAATTAAAARLPVWLIKGLGCWSSNAYLTSIHQQPSLNSKVYKLVDGTSQPTLEPDTHLQASKTYLNSLCNIVFTINLLKHVKSLK